MSKKPSEEVLLRLDVQSEYESFGVTGIRGNPSSKGWVSCNAFGEDQRTGSAAINIGQGKARGSYKDHKSGEFLSFFDFALKYGNLPISGDDPWWEAVKHYAKELGVSLRGRKEKPIVDESFKWSEWSEGYDRLALSYIKRKGGMKLEALKRAGTRVGTWGKGNSPQPVFALPIWGQSGTSEPPIGWLAWCRIGGMIEIYQGDGKDPQRVKSISPIIPSHKGEKTTWVGADAHFLTGAETKPELVWKVEGHTDMIALMSIMPEQVWGKHVVVTNPNGCSQIPTPGHMDSVTGTKVAVLHDADEPGQQGAKRWCEMLSMTALETRNVQLPYGIEGKHGKDLRDWIAEGGTYHELCAMFRDTPIHQREIKEGEETEGESPATGPETESAYREQLLHDVGLQVLGEDDQDRYRIYSTRLMRSFAIHRDKVPSLGYISLLSLMGPESIRLVKRDPDAPGSYEMSEVREAIADFGTRRSVDPSEFIGSGIWSGDDATLLIGRNSTCRYNGSFQLERIESAITDGRIIAFDKEDWFDFDTLDSYVRLAQSPEWRIEVLSGIRKHLSKWLWVQPAAPDIVAGMLLASWIQTVLPWRPLVVVSGQSDCGKTVLFEYMLRNLFHGMCHYITDCTEAGLRQFVETSAPILLLDEFESSKARAQILKAFRGGSRNDGGVSLRGTGSQKASKGNWRMIPWMAAINVGVHEEADANRAIQLDLNSPPNQGDRTLVDLPLESELREIGKKLLAIAVVCAKPATELHERLKQMKIGEDAGAIARRRRVETIAIPAAMICTAYGLDETESGGLLSTWVNEDFEFTQQDHSEDHVELFHAILDAEITKTDRFERMRVYDAITNETELVDDALAINGVCVVRARNEDGVLVPVSLAISNVAAKLLKGTRWEHSGSILKLLGRIDGSTKKRERFRGKQARCLSIPWETVEELTGAENAAAELNRRKSELDYF